MKSVRLAVNSTLKAIDFRVLFTLFGVILIVSCWAALWSYFRIQQDEKEHQLQTQLENTSIAVSQSIANDVGQIDILLKLLAESTKYRSFGSLPLYEMRKIFSLKDEILHVSFVDADGNVQDNTAFAPLQRRVNIRDREHFLVHQSSSFPQPLFISKPLVGRGTGKHTLQFSRGIHGADGRFLGVLVAGIDPKAFLANLQDMKLGPSSGIALIGTDDIVRSTVGSFSERIGDAFRDREIVRRIKSGEASITESLLNGRPQLLVMRELPGYPLSIAIVSDLKADLSWTSSYSSSLTFSALILTVIVCFLMVVGHRQIAVEHLQVALQEQIASNEVQRNFISMASHEFRTPLAIIDSSAQKLLSRAQTMTPNDIVGRARMVREAVKRMTDLMESILVLAKFDRGGIELKTSKVELRKVLTECVGRVSDIESDRQFEISVEQLNIDLNIDRVLFEQAVVNLLSNAVKYSPNNKPIKVNGWLDSGSAKFEIIDNGIGVGANDIPKLFSRFFRAKTAEGIAGTGIGLYFVKLIIERHGGKIEVKSSVGVGTTFTVSFPISEEGSLGLEPSLVLTAA